MTASRLDFVYIDDVVNAVLLAMENENCFGEVVNVGSGKETSINELAEVLIRLFGFESVMTKYTNAKVGDIRRSCADLSKAKKLLGFNPKGSLEEGLRRLVKSLDAQ